MNNLELTDLLNFIAEELFPDLKLIFSMPNDTQMNVFYTHINLMNSIAIHKNEIICGDVVNKSKLEAILKMRIRDALRNLKIHIENSLEKLGETT